MPPSFGKSQNTRARGHQTSAERTGLRILRYILDHPGATRRDAARDLHLSFPNVCRLVAGFQEQRSVVEQDTKQTGKRGPRSKTLSLRADQGCTIGVDLEATHIRGIVLDFANSIRSVYRMPVNADATPESVVAKVAAASASLVASAGSQNLEIYAIGLALPGPVINQGLGRVRTELQGGLAEMQFVPAVRAQCPVETYAAPNDICFALGHHRMQHSRDIRMDVLVLNRFGLSAAVVHDSELYSGHLGLLPFGNETPTRHYRDVCTGGAILKLARGRGDHRHFQELISSPEDPFVREWTNNAIPAFAQAIYCAVMMYSPDRLIIEGIFSRLPREVRASVLDRVEREITRLGIALPEITFFEGDDLMGARGAAFVARDHIADDVILEVVRRGRESRGKPRA